MALPERIGKYEVRGLLGQGAMGVVYKAFDPVIQRPVAIKTLHRSQLGDAAAVEDIAARFRNEAQAVGRIAHPGVVAIYEFGQERDFSFIAMEYVEGRSLDHVLHGTPHLPEPQVLNIMDQLLAALEAAHGQRVWHRDIKPANLLIGTSGVVKLSDFGIARIENQGLTRAVALIGTPGYMAPEQYMGEAIDQRTDLFATGVLLYRLLTGKAAFSGTHEQVMFKILHEQPPAASQLIHEQQLDRKLAYDGLLQRAMAKRPDERFASAAEFRAALTALFGGDEATAIVPAAEWRRSVEAAAAREAAAHTGASSVGNASYWDSQALSRIERSLASHVGPMAKVMVRDAARHCPDLSSLAQELALHIDAPAKRAQFISAVTGGSQARPTTLSPASPTRLLDPAQGEPLSEELRQRAVQHLSRQLGPIAKVVVKRAAEQARGIEDFVQRVQAAAPEVDAQALNRVLRAND
ncbi:serine/threonine protein kinase [Pelomonas sp. V22]|uniref:serine/threonine-protein kinase n=1 Tax=Pelomonas sp. V22 TaxID=2822139 RepID=UPI0024A89FE6|nr:serine/threonine-protein kinase [Pelomonas sp. V22]MDI4633567.1 serine/threonine protein kinase [Pelomonas sp. V22]